jgi:hypothetical protein
MTCRAKAHTSFPGRSAKTGGVHSMASFTGSSNSRLLCGVIPTCWNGSKAKAAAIQNDLLIRILRSQQRSIKVALKQMVLHKAVFLKFALGMCFGNPCADLACVLQDFKIGQFDESV